MKKTGWFYIALAVLIPLVFHKAVFAQYLNWDDNALVLNNPILQMPFWEALQTSFTTYYHGDYFPLTLMSYWVDIALFGANATAQHIENLLLHMTAALLLFHCLRKLTRRDSFAFLVALVFAIHPLQTETVMWISERKSLLSAVFTFLSLRIYMRTYEESRRGLWYGLAIFFYVIAGLAKATAILMPLLFLLLDMFQFQGDYRKQIRRFLFPAVASLALMMVRIQAYSTSVGASSFDWLDVAYAFSIPVRAFNAIGIYFRLFFLPLSTSAIYPDFEVDIPRIATGGFFLILVMVISIQAKRKRELVFSFSWLWFLLFLLPVLQIFPRINYVNERYMYLPIIGFAGVVLNYIKPIFYKTLAFFLVLAMGTLSYLHSEVWTTNRNLWTETLKLVPDSAIALNNLGLEYQNEGNLDGAVSLYNKILGLPKDDGNKILAYNNLANIYADSHFAGFSPKKAVELLLDGIAKTKRVRDTYEMRVNLGNLHAAIGEKKQARAILNELLKDLDNETDYHFQWLRPLVVKQLDDLKNIN